MYKALYRKYRPSNFDEVVGQEVIVQVLKNSIKNNRISHAYLFTGPRGTGKTSIAKILAKTVNCEHPNGYLPCNECVSCTQTNNNTITDIIEIDAASNNGVDEIRNIRDKVNLSPSVGKYKIYIIDEVHMLTNSAFNALLKTLEEPPSHVIFILATTEPHKVLPTIISRCQRFDFKRIPPLKILEMLKRVSSKENIKISDEALLEIANICDGGMRDALSILDQVSSYNSDEISLDDIYEVNGSISVDTLNIFVKSLINSNVSELLSMIDDFYSKGKNIVKISGELVRYLKNVLLYQISKEYLEKNTNYADSYKEISELITKDRLISLIDNLNNSITKIKQSSDPKLTMELSIIKECIGEEENVSKQIVKEINNKKEIPASKEVVEVKIKDEPKKEESIDIKDEAQLSNESSEESSDDDINLLKEIRINNTLSKFDKKNMLLLKKELDKVNDYLLDDKFSKYASVILDSELKAASDEYALFMFDSLNMSNDFNYMFNELEYFLGNIFDKTYKVISVDKKSWEIIKKEFNGKTKEFIYKEEPEELLKKLSNNNETISELDQIFGNIVKYE